MMAHFVSVAMCEENVFYVQNGIQLRKRSQQRKVEPLKNLHHIFCYVSVPLNFVVVINKISTATPNVQS